MDGLWWKPYLNWWFGGTPIFGNTHIILKLGSLKTIDHTEVMEVENPESTKSMGKNTTIVHDLYTHTYIYI